jgi:hypothetical protein
MRWSDLYHGGDFEKNARSVMILRKNHKYVDGNHVAIRNEHGHCQL